MAEELSKTLYLFTSPTKLEIMNLLWEYSEGLTCKEILKLTKKPESTITHAITDLKRCGIIVREGKLRRLVLTDTGRKVLFAIKYIWEAVNNAKGKMGENPKKNEKGKS